MPNAEFCHLHVHTQYSLLDGACRIGPMVEKAQGLGMSAIAMTDHGNMYGVVDFVKTLTEGGLKPIVGYEGYLTPGNRRERDSSQGKPSLYHLTLLAENDTGLNNLYKLSSLAYVEGFYYKPRLDWDLLQECHEGVICLSGCLASRLNRYLLEGRTDEAEMWLGEMSDLFGPDRFYVELQDHGLPEQREVLEPALALARRLGLPVVATNDCHYLESSDNSWHDALLCISTRKTLDDPSRLKLDSDQLYFKTQDEMAALMSQAPDAISNTMRIAEMCNVTLDKGRKYPVFREQGVPEEPEGKLGFLRRMSEERLHEIYGDISPEMQERLDYELGVISDMGYVDYFLIVWDFARFARRNGIPIGMRGSGGGSLVAHAIGLSGINPMDYGLLFNRFLDPDRKEAPDIDIDLCERRREEVIQYAKERYGEQSTAQIITFGTLKARACIRDVGRVLGVDLSKVDTVAKLVPGGPKVTLEKALEGVPELKKLAGDDEEVERILEYAVKLEGMPRHSGVHAAGVVLGDQDLWRMIPLAKTSDDAITTQWAMGDLEAMGMLKLDFLGLRTLTIVAEACKLIEKSGKPVPEVEADRIDTHDAETYKLLTRGMTQGIFQFGSDGMKRLLKRLEPNCIEDLIAVVALYRPGPLDGGMVDQFIECKHGRQRPTYPHPAFEPILKPTYGVIVYQEQIMSICNAIAGMSMASALTMIKAISKKKEKVIESSHAEFVAGARDKGLDEKTAEDVFELIKAFAGYGFNKAHASAYAFLAYTTAFLKAHFPTEFMAASISCEIGHKDEVVALMDDCKGLGIEVLPPDINESVEEFSVVGEGRLRFGLGAVKNLGSKAVEAVIAARDEGGPFATLFDFCERVDHHVVGKGAVEALVNAGCFDDLPGERAQIMSIIEMAMKAGARARKNKAMGQSLLFSGPQESPEEHLRVNLPDVPPLSAQELARLESEALGLYVRYDPLVDHRRKLMRFSNCRSDELPRRKDGSRAVMGGMIEDVSRKTTRTKKTMAILKVMDPRGPFEVVLFPETWEKYGEFCQVGEVAFFEGCVSHNRGTSLNADEVIAFDDASRRLGASVYVTVPCDVADSALWAGILRIVRENKGRVPLFVDLQQADVRLRARVNDGTLVAPTERLAEQLEDLVGAGAVRFGLRESNGNGNSRPRWRRKAQRAG